MRYTDTAVTQQDLGGTALNYSAGKYGDANGFRDACLAKCAGEEKCGGVVFEYYKTDKATPKKCNFKALEPTTITAKQKKQDFYRRVCYGGGPGSYPSADDERACELFGKTIVKTASGFIVAPTTCNDADVSCTSPDYLHEESKNTNGPSVCRSDCDCDGARTCLIRSKSQSAKGYCRGTSRTTKQDSPLGDAGDGCGGDGYIAEGSDYNLDKANAGGVDLDLVASATAWVVNTTDKDACWDQDYADSNGTGNGWVEGKNTYKGNQAVVRQCADFYVVRCKPGSPKTCSYESLWPHPQDRYELYHAIDCIGN